MSCITYIVTIMHDTRYTARERRIGRRYLIQMIALMALYVVVLIASIRALETGTFSPLVRTIIAITPALPMAGVLAAVIQFMLGIDELQRQIHLEALAIAAGVTAAAAITYTFLENAGMPPSQSWWWFVCIDAVWACALPFVRRRYA